MSNSDNQRQQDGNIWACLFILGALVPSFRGILAFLLMVLAFTWCINVLGDSTVFNDPKIYYSGVNPHTGKQQVVQGCRPERLTESGECDKSITWDTLRRTFPSFGPSKHE